MYKYKRLQAGQLPWEYFVFLAKFAELIIITIYLKQVVDDA